MRTTLKRGLGRGAAPNGNGKAGAAAGLRLARHASTGSRSGRARSRAALVGRIAMWLGVACLVARSGRRGRRISLLPRVRRRGRGRRRRRCRRAARQLDVALPGQPAVALVIGYDHRKEDGPEHVRALGHAHARPRRPGDRLDLAPLVPARHARRDSLSRDGRPSSTRSTPPTRTAARRARSNTVKALTGVPINYLITVNFRGFRQIVDRLGGAWIDVDRRYFNDHGGPSGYATINLHPGLPAAHRAADARLRALPAHGLRPLPRRAPAAVREGVQGPDPGELRADRAAEGRQRDHEQRRGRAGRRRRRRRPHGPLVRAVRLRPARRARVPDADRGSRGLRGADDRLGEHHARGPDLRASRTSTSSEKATAVALGEKVQAARAGADATRRSPS